MLRLARQALQRSSRSQRAHQTFDPPLAAFPARDPLSAAAPQLASNDVEGRHAHSGAASADACALGRARNEATRLVTDSLRSPAVAPLLVAVRQLSGSSNSSSTASGEHSGEGAGVSATDGTSGSAGIESQLPPRLRSWLAADGGVGAADVDASTSPATSASGFTPRRLFPSGRRRDGTGAFTLPVLPRNPKPELVEKYLDPRLMSSAQRSRVALQAVRARFQQHEGDCGSSPVQIALLTSRIGYMAEHLKEHKKDVHSRRGLEGMLARRRKLLKYLRRKDWDAYCHVIAQLGLRDRVDLQCSARVETGGPNSRLRVEALTV